MTSLVLLAALLHTCEVDQNAIGLLGHMQDLALALIERHENDMHHV